MDQDGCTIWEFIKFPVINRFTYVQFEGNRGNRFQENPERETSVLYSHTSG